MQGLLTRLVVLLLPTAIDAFVAPSPVGLTRSARRGPRGPAVPMEATHSFQTSKRSFPMTMKLELFGSRGSRSPLVVCMDPLLSQYSSAPARYCVRVSAFMFSSILLRATGQLVLA